MTTPELAAAAQRYGTPLYVYDLDEVSVRVAELRAALPAGATLLYSLKANPLPPIAAAIRAAGCQAEVSSPGELRVALGAGYDPAGILYTGPGKSPEEIAAAIASGISLFSCESAAELLRLSDAAQARGSGGREVEVLLRLHPGARPAAGLSMADGRQFGFDPEEAIAACAAPRGPVKLRGFHVYLGSQLSSVETLLDGFAYAKQTMDQVCAATGLAPEIADLGGGFPWPYAAPGRGCALAPLADGLGRLCRTWATGAATAATATPATPRLWFESGRRLCAAAGWLLTSVMDVKAREGGSVVVVDAGINVLGGMSGLGRVLRPSTEFENLSAGADREPVIADVVGPLCTPLDRLAVRAIVRQPRIGDLLCVPNVGAYGPTASLTSFLSRPAPPEVVFTDGREAGVWRITNGHQPIIGRRSTASRDAMSSATP